jgi:hypothetical protein
MPEDATKRARRREHDRLRKRRSRRCRAWRNEMTMLDVLRHARCRMVGGRRLPRATRKRRGGGTTITRGKGAQGPRSGDGATGAAPAAINAGHGCERCDDGRCDAGDDSGSDDALAGGGGHPTCAENDGRCAETGERGSERYCGPRAADDGHQGDDEDAFGENYPIAPNAGRHQRRPRMARSKGLCSGFGCGGRRCRQGRWGAIGTEGAGRNHDDGDGRNNGTALDWGDQDVRSVGWRWPDDHMRGGMYAEGPSGEGVERQLKGLGEPPLEAGLPSTQTRSVSALQPPCMRRRGSGPPPPSGPACR